MGSANDFRAVRSAHPVEPEVRTRVLAELDDVERRHDVKVLFACESGSRGWGFASPDSDYDVRFVYVHRRDWYLRVEPQRDVIEKPIDDVLDVSGWELRKALQLLHRSNPTLLEWLDSPVVYREDARWAPRLRSLATAFFSPMRGRHHYLSMAKKKSVDGEEELSRLSAGRYGAVQEVSVRAASVACGAVDRYGAGHAADAVRGSGCWDGA